MTHANPPPDPRQVWIHLLRGNERFAAGAQIHPRSRPERREALVGGQAPLAAVLGCSDSRVSPELVFDQGIGDLFTVRTPGEVADNLVLGALEFAVSALRVPLLVVLGHTSCGALQLAVDVAKGVATAPEHVKDIVDRFAAAVVAAPAAEVSAVHAREMVRHLLESSRIIAAEVAAEQLVIVAAVYSLETGLVTEVSRLPGGVTPR